MRKMTALQLFASGMICTALVMSCGRATKSQDDRSSGAKPDDSANQDKFSLTIPESNWAKSKYCGEVTPTTPEDPTPQYTFDRNLISDKLQGEGLRGWMHGVVPSYEQYVYTYRSEDRTDPMAFFRAEQFSLVPASTEVQDVLKTLHRHDEVVLKGKIFDNKSPLAHLLITSVEVKKIYQNPTTNSYSFDLASLKGQKNFEVFGQIHATIDSEKFGRAIVIEHQDILLPVAISPSLNERAAKFYRGDIINLAVKVVEHPFGPPHFETDDSVADAITVVDPMLNCHGKEIDAQGYLVKFEKSPAISTDVYAVRVVDENGVARNFTFFPDTEDQDKFVEIFMAISAKAKAAWDSAAEVPVVGRNFWRKPSIKVSAKGHLNVVSLEQANAQVYLKSADDVSFTVEP